VRENFLSDFAAAGEATNELRSARARGSLSITRSAHLHTPLDLAVRPSCAPIVSSVHRAYLDFNYFLSLQATQVAAIQQYMILCCCCALHM